MELGSSDTDQQEEETSASGSAEGQTLSLQGGQPGWCLCNTSKANTGPCHTSAVVEKERPHPAGSFPEEPSRHPAALGVAQHGGNSTTLAVAVGNTYGLLPGSCLQRAPRIFPGKKEPLCPVPGPVPGRARRMPPRPVMSRQEGDCFGGSWVSGSTCPAPGPSTMAAFLRNCCRAANYPPLLMRDAK